MTLVKDKYIDPKELSKVTKQGIQIIGEMSTPRILAHVAQKHRVGLLGLSTFFMGSYIAYDKVIRLFV